MSGSVEVKLFATLAQRRTNAAGPVAITTEMTVDDLVRQLEIRPEEAKLVFVNNQRATGDTILKDGDRVGIFPPVGGG